jgi:N-acetylneuraminic acid mutarotase
MPDLTVASVHPMSLDRELVASALPLYEVHGELGRGAWGVVLAGHHRQLGRDVAIKQLPRAFGADPAVRSRFVAEARLLASLDHTHIVPIYDFVEHEGLLLLVMERLTGGTVWSRFKSGAFTPERSCAVALATVAALHYAHRHGVLHRDIKPDNLMFSSEGVLKVTDFGIAKVVGGSATVATRAGDVLGTPAYMAPEQAQGEMLGPATDVYALGTVLYELLAGRLPFPEDSNALTTLYRHVHERARPLPEVAPHVPPGLAEVTARALEPSPEERYADAEAFGVALASAAVNAWGPGWLAETGITVAAPGPVLSAAVGSPGGRKAETIVTRAVPEEDPDSAESAVTPADLVPVNLLRPSVVDPAPLVEPQPTEPPGPSDPPPPPPGPPTDPPAGPPRAPSDGGALRRRRALVGGAVVLVIALVAAYLVTRPDDKKETASRSATTTTKPASVAPVLEPAASWRNLRDAPTARQQLGSAVLDGTVWILGGLTSDGSTPKVEGYDPAIDTWKSGPDLPLALHHEMAAAYKDELVVLGGWVPSGQNLTATTSDKVFALRNGAWVELPHLLRPRAAGAAEVVGNRLVVFGGQAGGQLVATTEVFDGTKWVEGAGLPTPRDHLAAGTDGRYVYAVGGRSLSADKNLGAFERYDPLARRWSKLADLPTPRGGLGAAVIGGSLVAAGGESPTGVFDNVDIFDIASGSWSTGPAMGSPRHGLALATIGSTIYAFDGARQASHSASSAVEEALDFTAPAAPTTVKSGTAWRRLRDAPSARQQLATAVVDGTMWLLGGLTGDASTTKVEGYDPAIDTWKSGPELPLPLHHEMAVAYQDELVVLGGWVPNGANLTATTSDKVFVWRNTSWVELPHLLRPRAAGAAAVIGDRLVVFGGQAGGQLLGTTEVFDGTKWTEVGALPTPRDHLAGASDGHFIYAVGGRALSADKNLGAFERYDPLTHAWSKLADLPTPRGGLGAAVVGGRLVTVGGENATGVFDTVEIFDIASQTWAAGPAMRTPRHGLALASVHSTIYAVDGARQSSHSASTAVAEALDF